ncbi:MAG: hypothetical protein J6R45_02375, partial [Clostridia bacterium]|nr:hypothetical protein [Clostridia bacterium]
MKIAGICFLIFGGILLLISGFYICVYLIFEKSPQKTSRALGKSEVYSRAQNSGLTTDELY